MKDKEVNLEEIEVSHTLGGVGEGHVQGRGKVGGFWCEVYSTIRYTTEDRCHRIYHKGEVSVAKNTHEPL